MKEYLDGHELKLFRVGRESGHVSVFRTQLCRRCRGETYKEVPYCSKTCFNIAKELGMKRRKSNWDEEMAFLIGRTVHLETLDGHYLTGRLTGIDTMVVEVEGKEVPLPTAIEMDKDREKLIDLPRLKSIKLK